MLFFFAVYFRASIYRGTCCERLTNDTVIDVGSDDDEDEEAEQSVTVADHRTCSNGVDIWLQLFYYFVIILFLQ